MFGDSGKVAEAVADRIDQLLTARRLRVYPIVFLVLGTVTLLVNATCGDYPRMLSGQTVLPDFLAHWTGGRMLVTGDLGRLYDPVAQIEAQRTELGGLASESSYMLYVSPPFAVLLYAPFAVLPYSIAVVLWTLTSLCLLGAALLLARSLVPQWALATLVFASSQPVLELIGSGQDSAVSLLIWMAGLRLLMARRDLAAGAVLGLGVLKPQLFLLVPVALAVRGRFRALAGWTVVASGLGVISVALVGVTGVRSWIGILSTPLYQQGIQIDHAWKMQGIASFVTSMAPDGVGASAQWAGLVVSTVVAAAAVAAMIRRSAWSLEGTLAFASMTTVLVSPHLSAYDLVIVVPGILFLLSRHGGRRVRLCALALFLLTWTAGARHLVGEALPWPAGAAVGGSWTALPVGLLWWHTYRAQSL